jgi:hypothetical protein
MFVLYFLQFIMKISHKIRETIKQIWNGEKSVAKKELL